MDSIHENRITKICWFVGAHFGGTEDQTQRFVEEGIWENNYKDKYLDLVKSIQPGERIAIKAAYTRKHELPFNNRGQTVSVMSIKAIGIVEDNPGDGRLLKVSWQKIEQPREWYFYTNQKTVWRVLPGDWKTDALIDFAFNNKPQDIDRFRNFPFWRERFGDPNRQKERFAWSTFYEAFADKLLLYRDRREELIAGIHKIAAKIDNFTALNDQFADGSSGPLKDICPFTVMGAFNRGLTDQNRRIIASELAEFLGVQEEVPQSFEGLPVINNQSSWFFGYSKKRENDDIDKLWNIFEAAINYAESDDIDTRTKFTEAYDDAIKIYLVGWKLTFGLFWIRPWSFSPLDSQSRTYISKKLNIEISFSGPNNRSSGNDYLALIDELNTHFEEEAYPVHSFPELSYAAWLYKDKPSVIPIVITKTDDGEDDEPQGDPSPPPIQTYTIDNIIEEGSFLSRESLQDILKRLRDKKNLILQGAPGTGKTWLAKKIAYALIGQLDESKIRIVQFHPNLSYEDFIRGWRPYGDGKLTLIDGPFLEMILMANKAPHIKYVVVIEEINRGNPAQIFGEMLTLLEADKRTPSEAIELCYRKYEDERVHIPANLYVIGTMNIADRSLSLVDFALRRRFAFITLEPVFDTVWRNWVNSKNGVSMAMLEVIEERIKSLNDDIANHVNLGPQFKIGHSYFTPAFTQPVDDEKDWYRQVVVTEIRPLLEEYWFDSPDDVKKACGKLLEGF